MARITSTISLTCSHRVPVPRSDYWVSWSVNGGLRCRLESTRSRRGHERSMRWNVRRFLRVNPGGGSASAFGEWRSEGNAHEVRIGGLAGLAAGAHPVG